MYAKRCWKSSAFGGRMDGVRKSSDSGGRMDGVRKSIYSERERRLRMHPKASVGLEVRTLNNTIFRTLLAYEARRGVDEVTVMHGWIIGFIYENASRDIFQKDIEAEFSIAKSTVTGILKLMEKKGYIIRESVAWDARLKKLALTEKGRQLHEGTMKNLVLLEQNIRKNIPPEAMDTFFDVVRQMKNNLDGHSVNHKKQEVENP